ncbi:hypothetical protein [Helicobacter trogontum]|nr:hypothetical protein [Helicobacter trogontum]MCI5787074.1 hypothetical protein [Helicobacter trogontum]MDY5184395.1 hypothetical protein [Helicobacter trogontum]
MSKTTCPINLMPITLDSLCGEVILAQTDTTIGLLSRDSTAINQKKGASLKKPLLKEVANLSVIPHRTPTSMRNIIRRAKKTSFILPNGKSFRVIKDVLHNDFLKGFSWLYSSSANPTKGDFSMEFAQSVSDIIVLDKRGIFAAKSSMILKIGHNKIKKIR